MVALITHLLTLEVRRNPHQVCQQSRIILLVDRRKFLLLEFIIGLNVTNE